LLAFCTIVLRVQPRTSRSITDLLLHTIFVRVENPQRVPRRSGTPSRAEMLAGIDSLGEREVPPWDPNAIHSTDCDSGVY